MDLLYAPIAIAVGYLAGSISFAIIIGTIVGGIDIRDSGNRNPGTANVGRTLGPQWGAAVFFGDVAKAALPMALARRLFPDASVVSQIVVALTGIAALIGHRKPIFFRFKGGGGIAAAFGAVGFIAPIELLASMAIGFLIVQIFVRESEYRFGRWTAGIITLLTPIIVIISSLLLDVTVWRSLKIGGLAWYEVLSVWAIVGVIVSMNAAIFGGYFRKLFRW